MLRSGSPGSPFTAGLGPCMSSCRSTGSPREKHRSRRINPGIPGFLGAATGPRTREAASRCVERSNQSAMKNVRCTGTKPGLKCPSDRRHDYSHLWSWIDRESRARCRTGCQVRQGHDRRWCLRGWSMGKNAPPGMTARSDAGRGRAGSGMAPPNDTNHTRVIRWSARDMFADVAALGMGPRRKRAGRLARRGPHHMAWAPDLMVWFTSGRNPTPNRSWCRP